MTNRQLEGVGLFVAGFASALALFGIFFVSCTSPRNHATETPKEEWCRGHVCPLCEECDCK